MRTLLLLLIFFIGSAFVSTKTSNNPKVVVTDGYFQPPVAGDFYISGTFGELRPNHFHAGIDIKVLPNRPLLAVADGYISKISIEPNGYGKALFITHPNGLTSMYAHMNKFTDDVEDFVRQTQYARQVFETDIFLEPGQFNVLKGQEIGKSGMTGATRGPHLHFELRNTVTGEVVNPLKNGFKTPDNFAPRIHGLKVYAMNSRQEVVKSFSVPITNRGGIYRTKNDTISIGCTNASFGLKAYDLIPGGSGWNGVYSIQAYSNNELIYDAEMDALPYEDLRCINAHIDYAEQLNNNAYFNKCFVMPGNPLGIYKTQVNRGIINLSSTPTRIRLAAKDLAGNEANLDFWVKLDEEKYNEFLADPANGSISHDYFLMHDEENVINTEAAYLYFPRNVLFEDTYFKYHASTDLSHGIYSQVHQIHNNNTPIHNTYVLGIKPLESFPPELREKAFIAYCGKNGKIKNCGGIWADNLLQTQVKNLGDYYIMVDTIAPSIVPIGFKKDMRRASRMSFSIRDNYATPLKEDGLTFNAYIDGQWVLMEYDAKYDNIRHTFEDNLPKGEHQLLLVVRDNRNNERIFESSFIR